jgi:hypothetical protein
MANRSFVSGTFTSFYIGQAAASSTPLTQILNVGTGGYRVSYELPKEKYVACVNRYVQSGSAKINMTMSFISDDPQAFILAMGNWLSANQDDTPSGQQYSILLWDAINVNGSSLYIPICESETKWDLGRFKDKQTEIALSFRWQDANSSDHLFYKRSNAALVTQMGSKSPF